MSLNTKLLVAAFAVFVFTFGFESESLAQRGVRIGNFFQAGGGQGFRLGGPRGGMHFGGGQGASIGTQRFGMRFGNGQGARFGGQNYGMQFGGGQGTQFGRFATTPNVTPGTYYYGNPQGVVYPQQYNYPRNSNGIRSFAPANQPVVAGQPGVAQPGVTSNPSTRVIGNSPTPSGSNNNSQALTKLANPQTPTQVKPTASDASTATSSGEAYKQEFKDHASDAPGQRKTKVYSILNKEPQVQESLNPGDK